MVTTFADHAPVTPPGKPLTVAPVAPVVLYLIDGVITVLMHKVRLEPLPSTAIVLFGFTVIVPVAVTGGVMQPPVRVTV